MTAGATPGIRARRLLTRLLAISAVLTVRSVTLSVPPDDDGLELVRLETRVSQLRARVAQLAGDEDLLDTLHFGWFDRPYARATLAVLVKTVSVLERELYLRGLGNGAIPDQAVQTMLSWAGSALERVVLNEPDRRFRPHRLRTTGADFQANAALPPLYVFVDRASTTRHSDVLGDLDLLAALGMRIYARLEGDWLDPDSAEVTVARAATLGMGSVFVTTGRDDAIAVPHRLGRDAVTIQAVDLRGLLEGMAVAPDAVYALRDPAIGESWAASLARRAAARGVFGRGRYVIADWNPPGVRGSPVERAGATAAAMWVDAIEGQSLGLVPGWRDRRDGSASPFASILVDPSGVEVIARTALDLVRLGAHVRPFSSTPSLAIAVGADAIHESDDNAWAPWIVPIFEMLLDRQIRFDLVAAYADERELSRRYAVVFPLRRDDVGDPTPVALRIERALAVESNHVGRVTARTLNGGLAAGILVRDARVPGGRACVALANLSSRPRRVKLHGGSHLGAVHDVLANQPVSHPGELVPLAAWQVRLLWPAD